MHGGWGGVGWAFLELAHMFDATHHKGVVSG